MTGDQGWQWSDKFQDYFKWKLRDKPGRAKYDLVWGRSRISRDERSPNPSSPSSRHSTADLDETGLAMNDTLPYQLSSKNFPSITEVQENTQPPDIIHLDPTVRMNNSSPSWSYQRLDKPSGAENASVTTGLGTNTPTTSVAPSIAGPGSEHESNRNGDDLGRTASPTDSQMISRLNGWNISSTVDNGFEIIRNPRSYFKKGRVFQVHWPEPRGELGTNIPSALLNRVETPSQPSTLHANGGVDTMTSFVDSMAGATTLHVKTRTFVVIRPKTQHCLCLPVYTYSQQGTSKHGVKPEDHAPFIRESTELVWHPDEQQSRLKKPIVLILEDPTIQWSPLSRINLSKVQSVECNLKVKKVGRVSPESLTDLEAMFREAIGLSDD